MPMQEKKSPAISVVIPVYNVEAYLRECVDSVLAQTMQNFEILLVDDGATDNSGTICDEYGVKDERVRVIHRENGGLSAARNTGLDAAAGEYVYFLDSDDYIVPCALERLWSMAEREKADFVFFDASVFFTDCEPDPKVYRYERGRDYGIKPGRQMLLALMDTDEYRTAVPLMLFRQSYMSNHGLRFQSGILHEDELFTFYVYNANGCVAHCHEQLYARRMRPASIMTGSAMIRRYDSVCAIYFELSGLYASGGISGEAARRYLVRMSRSVIAKYRLLPEAEQRERASWHKDFQKDVLRNHGFGDSKLKIKCAAGIRKLFYRAEGKVQRISKGTGC